MTIRLFLVAMFVWALSAGLEEAMAEELVGTVVQISRGDMLTMEVGRKRLKIRLAEIIVPKGRQPFARRSKNSLSDMCLGKLSLFQGEGTGRDGAPVGKLWCQGMYANAEQVRRGMAWVITQFANRRSPLTPLQAAAQKEGLGLWAEKKDSP